MYKVFINKRGENRKSATGVGCYKTLQGAKMAASRNLPKTGKCEYIARIYDLQSPFIDHVTPPEEWRPTSEYAGAAIVAFRFNSDTAWTEVER